MVIVCHGTKQVKSSVIKIWTLFDYLVLVLLTSLKPIYSIKISTTKLCKYNTEISSASCMFQSLVFALSILF